MKSILIIGMGAFGRHLAQKLVELKNEVIIVDRDEQAIAEMSHLVADAQIGDCTKEEVLRALGVNNFDICFVTIGDTFQASLEITALLKDLGAKHVVSKASRDIQAKFLKRNGADQVVYPDKDMAEKLAIRSNLNNITDFFGVSNEYSIFELPIFNEWIGKSIEEINIRDKYHINTLVIKNGSNIVSTPKENYILNKGDIIMAFGKNDDIVKLTNSHF